MPHAKGSKSASFFKERRLKSASLLKRRNIMYAVIETGGKQYRVELNDTIFVEKLEANEGEEITLDKVLVLGGESLKVGAPYVEGAKVVAEVVKNGKGKKINVFTYRTKKGSKRALGHRQPYTKLLIKAIEG